MLLGAWRYDRETIIMDQPATLTEAGQVWVIYGATPPQR